jgi:hypothetical protein
MAGLIWLWNQPGAGGTTISAPFIDATAQTFAPSVSRAVAPPFIDATAQTFAPSVSGRITAPFIDQAAQVFVPTLHVTQVYAPFITATAVVHIPAVHTTQVYPPFIDAAAQTFSPSVSLGVTAPFIDDTAVLYTPSVATANTVSPPFINNAATVYAPTVHVTKVYAPFLAAYIDQVVGDGAVALWMLDEPSGTTVSDYIGSLDGTYQNSPTLGVTGPITGHTGTDFDSADNDGVLITDAAALHIANENTVSWSVEAWFKGASSVTDFGGPAIVAMDYNFGYGTTDYLLGFAGASEAISDRPSVGFRDATGSPAWQYTQSADAIDDGNWHHIVGVFTHGSSPTLDLYVDGVHKARNASLTNYPRSTVSDGGAGLRIGRGPQTTQEIDGSIAAVAIYDFALTGAQVASHYAAATIPGQAQVYAPTVTVGGINVNPPFINNGSSVFAPSVTSSVAPPVISSTAQTFAPSVSLKVTVPFIDSTAQVFAPAVHTTQVYAPFITQTAVVYTPAVHTTQVYVPFIDQTAQLFAPATAPIITVPSIASNTTLYAPSVHVSGVYAPFISPATQLFAPSTSQSITAPFISANTQLFAPHAYTSKVYVGVITSTGVVYVPTLHVSRVYAPFINQSAVLYAPTLNVGAASASPPFISATAQTWAPTLVTPRTKGYARVDDYALGVVKVYDFIPNSSGTDAEQGEAKVTDA